MSIQWYKAFLSLVIFGVIIAAGVYPFRKKVKSLGHVDFPIGETLATGVFLGAALLHMLPISDAAFREQGYTYPWAFVITGIVFLLFLWFEHLGKELYHHGKTTRSGFALVAWAMLSIHSLMLGAALGFSREQYLVFVLFLAIIVHKWAESFAIAVQLNKTSMSMPVALFFFISFALMTPLGIFLGAYADMNTLQSHAMLPVLMAASAGTFLYLGTLHGLERCVMVERCCHLKAFSFVIIGFVLMAGVAKFV